MSGHPIANIPVFHPPHLAVTGSPSGRSVSGRLRGELERRQELERRMRAPAISAVAGSTTGGGGPVREARPVGPVAGSLDGQAYVKQRADRRAAEQWRKHLAGERAKAAERFRLAQARAKAAERQVLNRVLDYSSRTRLRP